MWRRISNLFKGFVSLFISGLERDNPKALIEVEKENLREQIARFNDNLATHAGFAERLMRQVKNLEKQDTQLTAKAAANLKAGNRAVAGQYALQLKTVKEQLEENRQQLEAAEATYKKLIKSRDVAVKEARAKIGGNEMEGILVRALRSFETSREIGVRPTADESASPEGAKAPERPEPPTLGDCIQEAINEFRPSAHFERLQLMDLLAVKECTDARFLPKRFRSLNLPEINERIDRLKAAIGD